MKQFRSIEKIDTGILYALELTSSISVLLLAFGLIASMANVLTKGSVLTDNLIMQRIWAWTQCIAIDAGVAGSIIRTFRYYVEGDRFKSCLYGFLSVLLLFTAAIVSNIESVQQTLNLTLDNAYAHVFIPVEALIWIRSLAIVLLIVAHSLRHVQHESKQAEQEPSAAQAPQFSLTPELIEALRAALAQVTISEEIQPALLAPQSEQGASTAQEAVLEGEHEQNPSNDEQTEGEYKQETNNYERVKAYLVTDPNATDRDIAEALAISTSTANKWKKRVIKEASMHEQDKI
ncbi:MAG: hypothetical protein NVSMB38_27700 [Ktedonobacteraceae bacterium]